MALNALTRAIAAEIKAIIIASGVNHPSLMLKGISGRGVRGLPAYWVVRDVVSGGLSLSRNSMSFEKTS